MTVYLKPGVYIQELPVDENESKELIPYNVSTTQTWGPFARPKPKQVTRKTLHTSNGKCTNDYLTD